MMRFILRSIKNGCRLGTLQEARLGIEMESPLCMLYSKSGCVPYITRDLLEKMENLPKIVQMPSNLLLEHADSIKEFKAGIKKFTALEDFVVYFNLQDSSALVPKGYNCTTGVSVWGQGGKKMLNVEQFMNIVEAFQPDWFQAIADSDTDRDSMKKRIRKSVDRTLDYLDECVRRKNDSDKLKDTSIIGVIEGGYSKDARLRSAQETSKRPVAGFSLEGFHNFGPETVNFKMSDIEDLIRDTLAVLPEDKPRFLPGVYQPLEVIRAVRLGCDVFDSTYPYVVTERGSALVFNFNYLEHQEDSDRTFEVSLKDTKFKDQFLPILHDCKCYSCQNFTAAYIYHLVDASELLGCILLMIHNFHHYFRFFEELRKALALEKIDAFEEHFRKFTNIPAEVLLNSVSNLAS